MVLAHDINEKIRTKDIQILQNVTFNTMLLSTKTLEGLQNSGFYRPSPVQLQGIPLGKCGFDVLVWKQITNNVARLRFLWPHDLKADLYRSRQIKTKNLLLEAKSGTGKTAVFAVIALEKIDLSMGLQAVILSPTREIAAQICDVLKQIGSAFTGLCVEAVMGGLPVQDDIEKFSKNNVHIVVGSPGRLKHLIQDQHIDVSAVRLFVLDEADKLMEKCFLTDIKYIHSNLPKQKQVILSSATYPESCKEYLNHFVHGAQHVCPENNSVLLGVNQKVTYVRYNCNIVWQTKIRFEELIKILSNFPFKQCLIFCNYQVRVAELHRMLKKSDWPVEMLHGQQDQTDRLDALKTLQEYKCRILISTDLASRGIDASNIDLVINFEPPFEWQTYLHRIGRAGRFGSYGTAITIASEGTEQKKFISIFKFLDSSINLLSLWNNNDEFKNGSNKDIEGNKTSKLSESTNSNSDINKIGKCSESVNSEINSNNKISKSIENEQTSDINANKFSKTNDNNIENLQSVINEPYDSLFKTCNSKVEIESFEDLMLSYEKFNLTDPKVNYDYNCINLPDVHIEDVEYTSSSPCNGKSLDIIFNLENNYTKNLGTDSMSKVNGIESRNSRTSLNLKTNENLNTDFMKLGLPTEFSTTKNKNLNLTYETTKTEKHKRNKDKINNQNVFSQKEPSLNNTVPRYSKPLQEKSLRSKNSFGNRTELTGKEHKSDERIYKNNATSKCYTSSDISNYNNSYTRWYKQLKLNTKQLELALYIDELSRI